MKLLLGLLIAIIGASLIIPFLKFTPLEPTIAPSPTLTPPKQKLSACHAFVVKDPLPNQTITPPTLTVTAIVDNTNPLCHWTIFEGEAGTVDLQDENGNSIGTGTLKTDEDWTANKPVTYTATISFSAPDGGSAGLVITEENPSGSGIPQTVTIPVILY